MNPRHPQVAARAGYRCEYCHAPEPVFKFSFEVEHIMPSVHAGSEDEANLALSCRSCNAHKSARLTGLDPENGATSQLFHPRQEEWERHFEFDVETCFIHGLTPVGWATVAALNMNSLAQCAARRQWIRLGLFP